MKRFITEVFSFSNGFSGKLLSIAEPFDKINNGHIGEVVFKLNYASHQGETWSECTKRVIETNMSIRKTHYINNHLRWDEDYWSDIAQKMAISMVKMEWTPAGRHLRNMGLPHVNQHGALSLNNCSAISTEDSISESAQTMYNFLKSGAGVGFDTKWTGTLKPTSGKHETDGSNIIEEVLHAYETGTSLPVPVEFKYPRLRTLYNEMIDTCDNYLEDKDKTKFVVDIMNRIGCHIVATSQRRGAQIAIGSPYDESFINLKNYEKYPERASYGWVSNNSVILENKEDFLEIPHLAKYIEKNGEPGIINNINMKKYGRHGRKREKITLSNGEVRYVDMQENVYLTNPCGEIALLPYELCNLSTTLPTNCKSFKDWYEAVKWATIFSSNVSLMMTENHRSNSVIIKNRKIGIGISGLADLFDLHGVPSVISHLNCGYDIVRTVNAECAIHAGVPISKKVTCIKPEGTVGLLTGTAPGIHHLLARRMIRRIRIRKSSPVSKELIENMVPYEEDLFDKTSYVFEFPMKTLDGARTVDQVGILEQLLINKTVQTFWADNNVSFTGTFKESDDIGNILGFTIPYLKTVSLLPKFEGETPYAQMPFEEITEDEYNLRTELYFR